MLISIFTWAIVICISFWCGFVFAVYWIGKREGWFNDSRKDW